MADRKYPVRHPKFALGIRSQETRAAAGRSAWAKKWFAALERMDMGGRFGRGRNYAMSGQVVGVEVKRKSEKGKSEEELVVALVQGARAEKYEVTIDFRKIEGAARARVMKALRSEPMLVARMLAGEMPMEVEEIFRKEGFDLYPGGKLVCGEDASRVARRTMEEASRVARRTMGERVYDVVTSCSCPDYANPCKHVFAAVVILGEEVARRPSLLVELRGITMEELT